MKNYSLKAKADRTGGYVRLQITKGTITKKDAEIMMQIVNKYTKKCKIDKKKLIAQLGTISDTIKCVDEITKTFM